MPTISAYSFEDVLATIVGPSGTTPLGVSAAPAAEGITVSKEAKNTKTVGADGSVMFSMHANESGKVTVRLQKTSPVNAILSAMYRLDSSTALNWGKNVIIITEIATGDVYTCTGCAFTQHPSNTYATEGNTLDWEFDAGVVDPLLGFGSPSIAA
jgi:hypothetical protein